MNTEKSALRCQCDWHLRDTLYEETFSTSVKNKGNESKMSCFVMPHVFYKAYPIPAPDCLARFDCGQGGIVCVFILEEFSNCMMCNWGSWEKKRKKNHLICSCSSEGCN